ncbi:MAG TPA: N-6 DNA methylase, partial [Candidatus Limnocylindrales bacterium]|nr:N-6 DNA methylase [Candidatus Limnocylindrales bacterium]
MPSQAEARAALQRLIDQYHSLTQERRNAVTEADVVTQYIEPLLFDVLGWPKDERHFFKELRTASGRPDITLKAEGHEAIYIEAKTFGVIKVLQEARSKTRAVLLPEDTGPSGVAYERSPEELQAVNYAFREQSEWAILTNFEHFRLFNARYDRLVLAVEQPALLAEEDVFDLLWLLAYPNVLNGSLEQLRTVHHAPEVDTKYLQFINEWREKLAQDLLERPAANRWLFRPDGSIDLPALREVVQRYLDRLVLVRFAEDHLVIKAGTLWSYYENRRSDPYTFTLDQYIDHLMRSFNELHNSALFAPHLADEANFSDGALLELIPRLYEARYRSMPADILGNTYEQYLGKRLAIEGGRVTTHNNLETRKKQGSYYTPQVIVRHLVDTTLGRFLYGTRDGQPNGAPVPGETRQTADSIRDLRVLDAACGSGSFLIYAYEVLARFYKSETMRLEEERDARGRELEAQGYVGTFRYAQLMPFEEALQRIRDYPRLILETHLYGVDLDPQAAELAVVNLIMRAMERAAASMDKRLPLLLNQNIKIGNGLVGLLPNDPRLDPHRQAIAEIAQLRAELRHTSHGLAHEATQAALETATAALRAVLDSEFSAAFDDGERVRPFHWGIEFPEVFCDETGAPLLGGGFTVIFGNPPWEIVMPEIREFYAQFDADIESKLNRQQVEARIEELNAEDPSLKAQWEAVKRSLEQSAVFFRQSPDYTRQGRGHTATHKLFIERMWRLLKHGGRLGYVVPSGIYTDLGTKDLRQMLLFSEGSLDYLYSFSNERYFFNGVDHRFKFCLLAAHKDGNEETFEAAFRFNPRVAVAPGDFPAFISDPANRITVERESIRRFSPDSLSLMEFQNPHDYAVAEQIYGDWPLLGDETPDTWTVRIVQEINVTADRGLLNGRGEGVPIYEGKMIHQFDAFY